MPTRLVALSSAVLVLVLVGVATFVDARPPAPRGADAAAAEFSAGRAAAVVTAMAREPRPLGSPASDRVRDDLVRRLDAAGMDARVHVSVGATPGADVLRVGAVENVVASMPGTEPTGSVILMAHYDTVARGPGAADAMAGVAAILETVRAVSAGPPLRNDLLVVITDGEEDGLLGAQAWVRDELVRDPRPAVTLNFEARGTSGPSLMFETSPGDDELVRALADAVPHPTGDSSLSALYALLDADTDLSVVLDAGRAGMNFAFVENPVDYHTAGDVPENLSPASLQGHGDAALSLTRAFGGRDLASLDPAVSDAPQAGDRTYFRYLGTMATYPQALALPLAGLAALAVGAAVVLGRIRETLSLRGTAAALGATLLAATAGAAAGAGVWQLVLLVRPAYADTGGLLAHPLGLQVAYVLIATLVALGWLRLLARRFGATAAAAGPAVLIAALAVVTAWLLPGLSFVFAWSALGLGIALAGVVALRARPVWATVVAVVGALDVVVFLVPLGWAWFGAGGLVDGLPVALFVVAGAALAVVSVPWSPVPGAPQRPSGRRGVVVTVSAVVVLAGAAAGTGLVLDRPTPRAPQASSLSFLQDTESGVARWVSPDRNPADWTADYLDSGPAPLPGWVNSDQDVRTGPATPLSVPGPRAEVVRRLPDELVLRVSSPRGAPTVLLRTAHPVDAITVSYPSRTPVTAESGGTGVRLGAVPAQGVLVTLRSERIGSTPVSVTDISDGLDDLAGFVPRPPELRASPRSSSDQVLVVGRVPDG